eukprot:CAMPEP_0172533598 /NCGR_PEP_ID=MMETSP1067-20121228/6237_1 /TAXON_ID=265564 ORGANISM="Thalassiosira punctigera, Strain Tpunct2005C2" /NCGR_SAMPLE_ID=MMETSP1067 /ASSEMBLY_ACC=CAM_ASM_000444 /LENGTH=504 /DNA_ID=CAMNT_0013318251 /DNA_START=70 /DNA_END=1584 /DNA_ORIENTATION=-
MSTKTILNSIATSKWQGSGAPRPEQQQQLPKHSSLSSVLKKMSTVAVTLLVVVNTQSFPFVSADTAESEASDSTVKAKGYVIDSVSGSGDWRRGFRGEKKGVSFAKDEQGEVPPIAQFVKQISNSATDPDKLPLLHPSLLLSRAAVPSLLLSKAGKSKSSGYDCERDGVNSIVVFGDSVSDIGNANLSLKCQSEGVFCGDRNSNGPVAVDFIAKKLCVDLEASLVSLHTGVAGNNYAVAGARAFSATSSNIFQAQVSGPTGYLNFTTTSHDTLYLIWFGSNDIRDAVVAGASGGPEAAMAVIVAAIDAMRKNIQNLIDAGACSFLVLGNFDISFAPFVKLSAMHTAVSLGLSGDSVKAVVEQTVGSAAALSGVFNMTLEGMVRDLVVPEGEGCLGTKYIDTMSATKSVQASDAYKTKFGMFDPNAPATDIVCNFRFADPETGAPLGKVRPVLPEGGIDSECKGFPFYDELHLSTDVYELFTDAILDDVEDFVMQESSRLLRKGH